MKFGSRLPVKTRKEWVWDPDVTLRCASSPASAPAWAAGAAAEAGKEAGEEGDCGISILLAVIVSSIARFPAGAAASDACAKSHALCVCNNTG